MSKYEKPVIDVSGVLVLRDCEYDPKILIARRVADGIYTLPGGKMLAGESSDVAAARELKEETGLVVDVNMLIPGPIKPANIDNNGKRIRFYEYALFEDEAVPDQKPKRTEPDKLEDWEWCNLSRLQQLIKKGEIPQAVLSKWLLEVIDEAAELMFYEEVDEWRRKIERGEVPAWILIPREIREALAHGF
jgi:8-oxo-dGTP pyrophosphatase MutT (NUDIX family)